MRPLSRGYVNIQSADPAAPPLMNPNFLSDAADVASMLSLFKFERKVLNQPALAPFLEREVSPGAELTDEAELLDFVRATGSTCYLLRNGRRPASRSACCSAADSRPTGVLSPLAGGANARKLEPSALLAQPRRWPPAPTPRKLTFRTTGQGGGCVKTAKHLSL